MGYEITGRPNEVTPYWIWYDNVKYSRTNAGGLPLLGRWGIKEGSKIDFQDDPFPAWLKGNGRHTGNFSLTNEQQVELNAGAGNAVDIGNFGRKTGSNASFVLKAMKFVNERVIKDWLNDPQNAADASSLRYMKGLRIATTILLLVRGDPENIDICEGVGLSLTVQGDDATVAGNASFESCTFDTFSFSSGSSMAFQASEVLWDKKTGACTGLRAIF